MIRSFTNLVRPRPALPTPKNTTCEVLHELLVKGQVSCIKMSWLSGFRTRISNLKLKHNLRLESKIVSANNKHGNPYTYTLHILPEEQRPFALQLYKNINK